MFFMRLSDFGESFWFIYIILFLNSLFYINFGRVPVNTHKEKGEGDREREGRGLSLIILV